MRTLLDGIAAFRAGLARAAQHKFAKLALGQSPDAAFIGCSDSRVDPRIFASKKPGDVFVTRNVGNLVPANGTDTATPEGASTLAVIEFALVQLKVAHIIICGHSECGAMRNILDDIQLTRAPHLNAWLEHGRTSLTRLEAQGPLDPKHKRHNQLSQMNVLEQIDHLKQHPLVRERLEAGALQLHGWWFEIATATVYAFDHDKGRFLVIDKSHAKKIRERAATIGKPA